MEINELQAGDSTPALPLHDETSPLDTPSYTPLSMPERGEPSRKLRRRGSRILSVLRSLTNNSGELILFLRQYDTSPLTVVTEL